MDLAGKLPAGVFEMELLLAWKCWSVIEPAVKACDDDV